MLPDKRQNQLASYYEAEIARRGNQRPEHGYSGIGYWWYGYPVQVASTTGYGAMSNASTQDPTATVGAAVPADYGQGIAADAGFNY